MTDPAITEAVERVAAAVRARAAGCAAYVRHQRLPQAEEAAAVLEEKGFANVGSMALLDLEALLAHLSHLEEVNKRLETALDACMAGGLNVRERLQSAEALLRSRDEGLGRIREAAMAVVAAPKVTFIELRALSAALSPTLLTTEDAASEAGRADAGGRP